MRDSDLPSIVLAAATLMAVLLGSFLLANRHLTDDDDFSAEASAQSIGDCLAFDGCRRASAKLREAYDDPAACDGAGQRVCLVAMGDVPKDVVDTLVAHYKQSYGLTLRVLPPLDLRNGFDRRTQLDESLVHAQLYDSYRAYANDRSVTLIGLLPVDIYLANRPSAGWSFGRLQGEARPTGGIDYRGGIISMFRMDPSNWSLPEDNELRDERIIKMVSKYIAHAHYDLPVNTDRASILYEDLGDLPKLDAVQERIPVPPGR